MTEVKIVEIFKDSHLPKEGWLQSCFNCYSITSKTFYYKMIMLDGTKYKFHVYCCPQCKNKMYKEKINTYRFSKICDRYINYHYGL